MAVATSASADPESHGLLSHAESGAVLAGLPASPIAPSGRRLPRRISPRAVVVAFTVAFVLVAPLVLLQSPASQRSQVTSLDAAESKVEVAPTGFNFSTPVSLRRATEPEVCLEVVMQGDSPQGQSIKTMPCGTMSYQWIVPETMDGRVIWSGAPDYCLGAVGNGDLELASCASVSAADSEFTFSVDGKIQVKARMAECLFADPHTADRDGRVTVVIQYCDGGGGDAPVPPDPADFQFAIGWPATSTLTTTTTEPPFHIPKKVIFKSTHGKYMVAELAGMIYANRDWADDWEKFDVTELGGGIITLRTYHKKYLSVDALGNLNAFSTEVTPNAHFELERNSDGTVTLKTAYGRYLCAEPSGFMIGNRPDHDDWEHFEIIDMAETWPEHVCVKSLYGKYLRAYPDGALKADGVWPLDDWEKLTVVDRGEGILSLRCDHGEFLKVAQADGAIHVSSATSSSDSFKVTHLSDGNFTMQGRDGKYVWAERDGTVHVDQDDGGIDPRGHFQVVFVY